MDTMFTNPITYLILCILGFAAWIYAYKVVRPLRRRNRDHGQTALLVVIGSAGVGIAFTVGLAVSLGIMQAIVIGAWLIVCNIVAGAFVVWEYTDDHTGSTAPTVTTKIQRIIESD